MSVEERIYECYKNTPQKTAIIAGNISVTYRELWSHIINAAQYYKDKGLRKGERILISASKNIEFIYAYFGAHLNGNICIPIDPETNSVRLQRILSSSTPVLFVGQIRDKKTKVISFEEIASTCNNNDFIMPEPDDIADILFTTGTTGMPKGVGLSYKNLISAADNINTFVGNTNEDIELLALPISHSFGLGRLRCVLSKGGTLVLLGSFAGVKKVYNEIERCKITGFGMVPASWLYLQKMSGDRISLYADQLKYIEMGSAFMSLDDKYKLMELLPYTKICMHYGLTEASRSSFIDFHKEKKHLDSIGKSSPNTDIMIFDEQGNPLKNKEEGEICVKGNHTCVTYWNMPKENFEEDFFNGYFRTGDWGYKDDDGYIYLKSRKKEIINVGGKKVSPMEVEEIINQMEGVVEAACIGVSDPNNILGEVVKAYIVCKKEITLKKEDVISFMGGKIESYKIPVFLEYVDNIPKTNSGKIQRLLLK